MPNDITIIRAGLEHIDVVTPLFDGYRQFYGQASDPEPCKDFVAARITNGESVILLATSGEDACGFTQLYPAFSSVSMRSIWILNDLFVAPDFRRSGVGRRLVGAATDFARESHAARLTLCTEVDNTPAQQLYERLGWNKDMAFQYYNYQL